MSALIVAVVVLLVGAAACLLPVANRARVACGLVSQGVAMLLVLTAVVPVLLGGAPVSGELPWAYPMGTMRVRLDALGAFFLVWSLPMTLLGSIYAVGYLRSHLDSARHLGWHFALLNLTALSFVLVYTGDHALVFLLGWETAAIAAWLLVIWDYTNQKVRFAGFNYLVSTHFGLIFLVAAFMILYAHTLSWDLLSFGDWLRGHPGAERNLVFLLLVTSFGLKSAFFPFHSWLPRAHAAAPAHVSALMSGVIHKAGLYALVRVLLLIGTPDAWMGWFLIGFSLLSAVIGALYTIGQRDLKRLLGYSSTENVGIAGIGFGVGCLGLAWHSAPLVALGFAGGLLHVLNHAFFKCQLFYAAGAVYRAVHTVDVERLGGLLRLMPWTSFSFLLGGIAISGMPPLNGFTSEFVVYSGLFTGEPIGVWARVALGAGAAALAFVGAVSAFSITRAFGVVFLGRARDTSVPAAHEVNAWMLLPMGIHGVAVVLLGVMPSLGLALVRGATDLALAALPGARTDVLTRLGATLTRVGLISGAVSLGVAALVWALSRVSKRPAPTSATWACGDDSPSARMQYTGSSFSADLQSRVSGVVLTLRRQKAPAGYFPVDSYLVTTCVDAVERRLFAVIANGDASAHELSSALREDDPRIAFAAALIVVIAMAGLVVLVGGPLQ